VSSLHLGRGPGFGFGSRHGGPPRDAPPRDFPSFVDSSQPQIPTQLASASPSAVVAPIARYSETLLGHHVLPVSVVVVANQDPLRAAFEHAGWTNRKVSSVTPTFVDSRTPDAVLERTTSAPAVTRIAQVWKLPLEIPNGCPVWAVTVAQDAGTKWTWPALYPEHRIASRIDSERDALADELVLGSFEDLGRFSGKPAHGSGPAGSYVTDGKVALIRQPACK
jgi:hypothetical protein